MTDEQNLFFRFGQHVRRAPLAAIATGVGFSIILILCCGVFSGSCSKSEPTSYEVLSKTIRELRIRPQIDDGKVPVPQLEDFTIEDQIIAEHIDFDDWKRVSEFRRRVIVEYLVMLDCKTDTPATVATRREFYRRAIDTCAKDERLRYISVRTAKWDLDSAFSAQALRKASN